MTIHKISSIEPVVAFLTDRILSKLADGQRVLWFVPGGSSIAICIEVSKRLQGHDLSNLTVTLTDERFGLVGHADSNWQQLETGGFMLDGVRGLPVLKGLSREETVANYATNLEEALSAADYRLGFFGMGADGHTAGALPGSPAVMSQEYAVVYDSGTLVRITMTPVVIAQLDEAVLYATGEEKLPMLKNLQTELPIEQQPAQILKKVPVFTIFNDQIGESV